MESPFVFASIVTEDEWRTVPAEIGEKICKFANEQIEELITSKALLETKFFNIEKSYNEVKSQNEKLQNENDTLQSKLSIALETIKEHETRITDLTNELNKLYTQCNTLEEESAHYRHERNLAIDEREEHLKLIQRRDGQIERLQSEVTALTKQLEHAINTKCEALVQAEDIAAMKVSLEFRENRLEQERQLINSQVESLTETLNKRTEELLNIRRDTSSRCIYLETKLSEKCQQLELSNDQIKSLSELNESLAKRNEDLAQKLFNQKEEENKMQELYMMEMDAKIKMANGYKEMYEDSEKHAAQLNDALKEVQTMLQKVTNEYGELETKSKETKLQLEEIISKKNECIDMLKKELDNANDLVDRSDKDIDGLSPSASSTKFIKPGMSYSELYHRYVTLSEQYTSKDEDCVRLNNYVSRIVKELHDSGPLIKKLREDYAQALDDIYVLKESNERLGNEMQHLREMNHESKRAEGITARENERLKKELTDLSRQVVHLLQQQESMRGGSSSTSTDNDLSDSVSSADIISKKLVTFSDITELQATNQKLLALVRELSKRQEEVESIDPSAVAALKLKLEELRDAHQELLEERENQTKMMVTLRNQRDMYKNLYGQAVRANGEDISMQLDKSSSENDDSIKLSPEKEAQLEKVIKELESTNEKLSKHVEILKEENETYRKEKSANEKILLEQLENMRGEIKELTRLNCQLTTHSENLEEKFKVMQNNVDIYKKQIAGLEKQNKIYNESIIKHEQAESYLKDETLKCQTKLSKAEVMLSNLQKENALLKDSENRLLKEREGLKKESHQQNLIRSNIELIKATLERNDAESNIRLEARLDEAHRECSALRRRLQEEQDHFRLLTDQLEKQMKSAKEHMEEEKSNADALRKEVAEARQEIITKSNQIDELSKKLKMGLFTVPDSNAENKKVRDLELQIADYQAEINSLKANLKSSKEASDEYFNVAQTSEKQVKELMDQNEVLNKEIETHKAQIKKLQEKCSELEGELSIQLDDQDITNAGKSKSLELQAELNVKTMDLKTARDQLENARSEIKSLIEQLKAAENKYAREVVLHSADLQELTTLKEELNKVVNKVKLLESEKTQAIQALEQYKLNWEEQEKLFQKEKQELESRFQEMEAHNSLLHDQIQVLNSQLNIIQAQATDQQNQSLGDSFNRSFTEDEVKSSEQLLKIVKYLRQEKDIAVSKVEIIEAEHLRLKSQFEYLSKQFEETKKALEDERQKSELSMVVAMKHDDVVRKLETLNAVTDSNRSLRQERDSLLLEISALKEKVERLQEEVVPLQEKNRELSAKADQLQTENVSLRGECTRWRQRANMLIEKSNRTSPEDWKKLQTERETLAKQLTIERSNTTKLNDDINNLRQDKSKLEEQLRSLRAQNNQQTEEINKMKEDISNLQAQITQLTATVDQQSAEILKLKEENRVLTEDTAGKDVTLTELRNNLAQVRKIAKKYKIQCEDQGREIEVMKQQKTQSESEQSSNAERQEQLLAEQRTELEERITQLENQHKEAVEQLNQQLTSFSEQNETYKKEIENLKQTSTEKEERFKTLFKNAKERIMSLTEQNASLKDELNKQDRPPSESGDQGEGSSRNAELLEKIATLEREREESNEERQQEKEKFSSELESLNQRVTQLQRQLGLQQGAKPSTSSASSEKSSTERPTADIKPMAGHSTNTQTQSVPIQPWRSGGEPPLASIRPMSAQLRTVAVLPTSQSPSAVMVPPQQVHTTGSNTGEVLSSSPTSSHTDYVPATSSASSAMLGPRQVIVPPTQSSQDTEDDDGGMQAQTTPQTQAVALVLPRVEPPSGATQEQGTSSSSSSNTVTTTQAGHKRQRDADMDSCQADEQSKNQQQSKRTRLQAGTVSESGLEVEYQVPTSSQRDHDDDNVIVVESDEEGGPDEGEGADDDQEDPDTEGYDMEGMEQDNYGDADCQEVEDEEEAGNEVEVIEDSSEVPNQSERRDVVEEENSEQPQSEAISSGTDGSNRLTISQASTSTSTTVPSFSRSRPVAPLSRHHHHQQSHLVLPLEDLGDDCIVPSTPTLYVPRRSDGFGEAVSSPHVPTATGGRFTFGETTTQSNVVGGASASVPAGSSAIVPEQALESSHHLDDCSTGRSVPTTPLQSSPQEAIPGSEEQLSGQGSQQDEEIPSLNLSSDNDNEQLEENPESMGPPTTAGPSSGEPEDIQRTEDVSDDGVSSEGEKTVTAEENEEEGREAEASPSTNSRRIMRGSNSARRSVRTTPRLQASMRMTPTPIVWDRPMHRGQQQQQQQQQPQQQHPQERARPTGGSPNFQARPVARRARGRMGRPFSGRF